MSEIRIDTIEEALQALREGKMVVVVDDEERENEGDLVMAAEFITPQAVNFMVRKAGGLICVPLTQARAQALDLPPMTYHNTTPHRTNFTISVDYIGEGNNTGISASDRARTIRALADPTAKPKDFARPGHIFPLVAVEEGVLRRAGHTEAAVDLLRLAGLTPVGVIVEIMNEDGTMARLPELRAFADTYHMPLVTVQDLIRYRLQRESTLEKVTVVNMPTKYGHFLLHTYKHKLTGQPHIALTKGTWDRNTPVLVRVHSSCFTGDILNSLRCDCGDQLVNSLKMIEAEGRGVLVYINQEGRGIGFIDKMLAYKLQEEGLDTVEANLALGHKPDPRDYGIGAQILRDLGVGRMKLITNNPRKRVGLQAYGLEIVETVPIRISANCYNEAYLKTKKERLGHDL